MPFRSEAFLEAAPTTLIIAYVSYGEMNTIVGSSQFVTTLTLSMFSATVGLAKCLKDGVAGTFQPGGILDGFCSVQFLLAFLGWRSEIKHGVLCFQSRGGVQK